MEIGLAAARGGARAEEAVQQSTRRGGDADEIQVIGRSAAADRRLKVMQNGIGRWRRSADRGGDRRGRRRD